MITMKSRTSAKAETSEDGRPEELAKGVMETGAVRVRSAPVEVLRSSWRKERKLVVSLG